MMWFNSLEVSAESSQEHTFCKETSSLKIKEIFYQNYVKNKNQRQKKGENSKYLIH